MVRGALVFVVMVMTIRNFGGDHVFGHGMMVSHILTTSKQLAYNQIMDKGGELLIYLVSAWSNLNSISQIFRETSNIYDGSAFTADMAVQVF